MRLSNDRSRGSALVLVVIALVMVMGIITAGAILLRNSQDVISDEAHVGQAVSISMAGLSEALSWFRRQIVQPVQTFSPQLNLNANPPINDTDDPNVGIVREFQISQAFGLWGRYEARLLKTKSGGGTAPVVRDVSVDRNLAPTDPPTSNGWSWYIESTGIIFKKADSTTYLTANFYQTPIPPYMPNGTSVTTLLGPRPYVRIVTSATTCTEIRRLVIQPPGAGGALCSHRGDAATIGTKSRVAGGKKPGIVYPTGTGSPTKTGELTGTPTGGSTPGQLIVSPASNYVDSVSGVFGGMSNNDLRTTADIYATSVSSLPSELPQYGLIYFKGNATFDSSHPLVGAGILFVEGNLTIDSNSNSFYGGVIYVQGNYIQRSPSLVKGLVIVTGTSSLSGTGDFAELDYDPNILNQVLMFMGQYRFSKPITFVRTAD